MAPPCSQGPVVERGSGPALEPAFELPLITLGETGAATPDQMARLSKACSEHG